MITQGITGFVYEEKGNMMPMIGQTPPTSKGIAATVEVYEATNIRQAIKDGETTFYTSVSTKKIVVAAADSLGKFSIALPAGRYSLFIKIGEKLYANSFNEKNDINVFTVEENKVTEAKIVVNNEAVY